MWSACITGAGGGGALSPHAAMTSPPASPASRTETSSVHGCLVRWKVTEAASAAGKCASSTSGTQSFSRSLVGGLPLPVDPPTSSTSCRSRRSACARPSAGRRAAGRRRRSCTRPASRRARSRSWSSQPLSTSLFEPPELRPRAPAPSPRSRGASRPARRRRVARSAAARTAAACTRRRRRVPASPRRSARRRHRTPPPCVRTPPSRGRESASRRSRGRRRTGRGSRRCARRACRIDPPARA